MYLPIRHGEGRLAISSKDIYQELNPLAPLRYVEDVNGSYEKIAGLVNSKGNVLGLSLIHI